MKKYSLLLIVFCIFCIIFPQKIHVVRKGDTLWDLSGYYYNNPFIWRNIYNANMDKIEDPHWIYPGQEFIIPDIPADAVSEYMETTVPESVVFEERKPKDIAFEEQTYEDTSIKFHKDEADEKIGQIKTIREEIRKVERAKGVQISNKIDYAVSKKLAFRAGYIAKENPSIGSIKSLETGSYSYTTNENIYINLNDPSDDLIGKEFIIYKWTQNVSNSQREFLGKYVKILGTVIIKEIEGNIATGIITGAYDIIKPKDFIAHYSPPYIPLNESYLKESTDTRAYLIAMAEPKNRVNQYSIGIIDIGKEKGINSGDVFTIIRMGKNNNYYAAGAVQILVPFEGYSTVSVLSIKGNVDIKPLEELKLSYRNKNAFILSKYSKITEIESEGIIKETPERIMEEIIIEEEIVEEKIEEPIIVEQIVETPVVEEPVIVVEEKVIEEKIEEPVIIEETPVLLEEDTVIEEESKKQTEEGFILIEEETDTTDTTEDYIIIEGEGDIIIIE